VKGKDLSKGSHHGRYIAEGCFDTVGQSSKELLVAQRIGDFTKWIRRKTIASASVISFPEASSGLPCRRWPESPGL
jgi:hypothetical protein